MKYVELLEKYEELLSENKKLKATIVELKSMIAEESTVNGIVKEAENLTNAEDTIGLTKKSSTQEKLELFLSIFRGRTDVCAKRWRNKPGYSPYCFNDFKPGICNKPWTKCTECKQSNFAPLDRKQLEKHLLGNEVIGLYPLTINDACYLLAIDFDKSTWREDITVVRGICRKHDIPMYVERSRSGDGAHLWFFFDSEIKAAIVRKFGMCLLEQAMQVSGRIGFDSFDRLFPSQDYLQKDGFGNLIALPLQKEARKNNNSVFIDENLEEIEDQWNYLSQVKKISEAFIQRFCKDFKLVSLDSKNEVDDKIIKEQEVKIVKGDFPEGLILIKSKGIQIDKRGISPKGLFFLRKLASYSNPEFYQKQAMRQSTYGTSRVTVCYVENDTQIILPRGVETELIVGLKRFEVSCSIIDRRITGKALNINFIGQLREDQEMAFSKINTYDNGVLSATTAFGKTVIGARLIAEKKLPTLVLVHTKELAVQWKERLEQFLEIDESIEGAKNKASIIGQLGGGKKIINGIVDVAIMQSMFEKDKSVKKFIDQYGLIIVDECHHVSAANFTRIISSASSKYVYGLTATPVRKDGHHPIIFMQCGAIRYQVDAKKEAKLRSFDHFVVPRFTTTRMPVYKEEKAWHITEIYQHVCESNDRNKQIVSDIEEAIEKGRNPLVLTERTSHIKQLVELLSGKAVNVIELSGNLTTKNRKKAMESIRAIKSGEKYVIIATGKLIGEGFDDARLDTLFMAMPIAWKGTIAQYAGRLHRNYEGKKEVLIYDYVDVHIPVLERMYHKRLTAYRSLGYSIKTSSSTSDLESGIFDESNYLDSVLKDIESAKKDVLISSPYLQKNKIAKVKDVLLKTYSSGIRVTLCTNEIVAFPDKQMNYIKEIIEEISGKGIDVIQIKNNRYRFMIIDSRIVWYGGIDILGRSLNEQSLIRIDNEALANELTGIIYEHISQ